MLIALVLIIVFGLGFVAGWTHRDDEEMIWELCEDKN